ncbi:hypothetical protein [Azospirillum sp. A23]|uniref:hypothetical protein n=1 Tax=Azospirillum sp. A23 TaxID=3160608 RepID=UPI0036F37FB7
MPIPAWLPDLIPNTNYNNQQEYKDALFAFFRGDFIENIAHFDGTRIGIKRYPERKGEWSTFHHITTRDINKTGNEDERVFCEHRSARIKYPRAIIGGHLHPEIRCWRERKKGEWRISILVEPADYIVILSERKEFNLLWTAYIIDEPHEMRKLINSYNRAVKEKRALEWP